MSTSKNNSNRKNKNRFQKICKLGEGSYGDVYKCNDLDNDEVIALKKIKLNYENEGIPSSTLREISLLQKLSHENVINLKEIQYSISEKKLFLIFEYIQMDYKKFIDTKLDTYNMKTIKNHLYQVLTGLDYIHSQGILHRDIKPHNLLINGENTIKIADFGLARLINLPVQKYTQEIQTLWYRAPELILGDPYYSVNVDIWSTGILFSEMLLKKPIFKGTSQIDQLYKVFECLGTPNELNWPEFKGLPYYRDSYPKFKGSGIQQKMKDIEDKEAIDLLEQLLQINPLKRITAREAMKHPFFQDIHNDMQVEQ